MNTELKDQASAQPEANATAATTTQGLLKDLAVQKDSFLRLAADFENFKRRSRQEAEARAAAQKDALILELLPVTDNLERALGCGLSSDSVQFHQGVEMTLRQLQQLLRQQGVESKEIIGTPYDPHRQEALAQGYDPTQPDRAVLSVLQRGYQRGDKVVRPAKVTVNDLSSAKQGSDGR